MAVKISRDKHISIWVDQENLIFVRWNGIKNHVWKKRRGLIEEKEMTLSEVKPVENLSKDLQSFLEVHPMQKDLPLENSADPYLNFWLALPSF